MGLAARTALHKDVVLQLVHWTSFGTALEKSIVVTLSEEELSSQIFSDHSQEDILNYL